MNDIAAQYQKFILRRPLMALIHTPAVVIHVTDYGESDKIVTFYTQKYGKTAAIAKGAKRSKKRFLNKLEYFSLLDIIADTARHSSLLRLDQAELIAPYPFLRKSIQYYNGAMLICELMRLGTRENDCDDKLYNLLVWSLSELNKGQSMSDIIIFFQLRMLKLMGYQLSLSCCTNCGIKISNVNTFSFSAVHNGLVCTRCIPVRGGQFSSLSMNTIKTLEMGQSLSLEKLSRLKFSQQSTREALTLLRNYIPYLLQRDVHSWKQLEQNFVD
ncbi:MAG: DNA repair protein RecO [Deltaproteobacteria bacterium]|nr:DNA repair protein RecO [Deltaproteobacteria bacterium]